jgi:hypothetical protein
MKTFLQFVNETIHQPAEEPVNNPPRKSVGHRFTEAETKKQEAPTPEQPKDVVHSKQNLPTMFSVR